MKICIILPFCSRLSTCLERLQVNIGCGGTGCRWRERSSARSWWMSPVVGTVTHHSTRTPAAHARPPLPPWSFIRMVPNTNTLIRHQIPNIFGDKKQKSSLMHPRFMSAYVDELWYGRWCIEPVARRINIPQHNAPTGLYLFGPTQHLAKWS